MTSNFCKHCGAKLSRPGAAFCQACGRPLGLPAAGQPPQTSGRETTVLGGTGGPCLVVQEPGQAARRVQLVKAQVTIGRDPANDLALQNPAVSRRHAQLEQRDVDYWITDLDSRNGTLVNGQRITQSHKLEEGDIIRIGDPQGNWVGLIFQSGTLLSQAGVIFKGQLDLAQSPVATIGRDLGNQLQLDHPTVSRHHARVEQKGQGYVISDLGSGNGTFVNGQPLRGAHSLENGDVVQIGPFKLVYNQASFTNYAPGGNYRLDAFDLKREVSLAGPLSPRRLLGLNGRPKTKVILDDVSLSIYPREFVALVGGSGTGKSTLMKALSGFTPAQGRVLLNGDDLYANFAAYRSILGYVPQDDIIHGQLTVKGALAYAAQLRLPDAPPQEAERRIKAVLDQVEMTGHEDKQVNRLSGGQRKRVSIAMELLAEPGLFFLDEPTSGLDPGLEKKMMYTMRQLADAGRTIVLVTHATANISQCTHVAFMAEGRLAYFGPPQEALSFFNATDFSDIYTRLSQPLDPDRLTAPLQPHYQQAKAAHPKGTPSTAQVWAAAFRASPDYQQHVESRLLLAGAAPRPDSHPLQAAGRRASPVQQFGVLARRYFDLIRHDFGRLFILLAVMPIIGLLLLVMAHPHDLVGKSQEAIRTELREEIKEQQDKQDPDNDNERFQGTYVVVDASQRLLFMLALAANLLGIFATAYEIVKEEAIYTRERMVNLKIAPYLLSKLAVLAGFGLLQCFLLLLVIRLKVDFPSQGVFLPAGLELYVTLFLATLASLSLGLLISALVRSADMVIYVILLVLFVQIIFAGAIFDLPGAAQPFSYLTTTRWTLEALGDTLNMPALEASGVSCVAFEKARYRDNIDSEPPCDKGQLKQVMSYKFNVSYAYDAPHLLIRWLVLGLFTVAFGWLAYVVQKRKDVV